MTTLRTMTGCAALAAGLLLAGCGDRGGEPQLGRFELMRTDAGELPAFLGERGGCRFEAVGGAVELRPDSSYSAELHRRRLCPASAMGDSISTPDTTFHDPGRGSYSLEGDSVFFRFSRGASAGFGVIRGDTLVVQGPGQTLHYRRVGPVPAVAPPRDSAAGG